jgi:hypothetical protein
VLTGRPAARREPVEKRRGQSRGGEGGTIHLFDLGRPGRCG